jgi:hypothetical protein
VFSGRDPTVDGVWEDDEEWKLGLRGMKREQEINVVVPTTTTEKGTGGLPSPSPSPSDKDSQGNVVVVVEKSRPIVSRSSTSLSMDNMTNIGTRRGRTRITSNWKKELDGVGWENVADELKKRKVSYGVVLGNESSAVVIDGNTTRKQVREPGLLTAVAGLIARSPNLPGRKEFNVENRWWNQSIDEEAVMVGFKVVNPPPTTSSIQQLEMTGGGGGAGKVNDNGTTDGASNSRLSRWRPY